MAMEDVHLVLDTDLTKVIKESQDAIKRIEKIRFNNGLRRVLRGGRPSEMWKDLRDKWLGSLFDYNR